MQFFKGELRLENMYYREKEGIQVVARKLNSQYWANSSVLGLHILISKVTIATVTFLIMYEDQDARISQIDNVCQEYASELCELSDISKVGKFTETIAISEITLNSFCNLFSEEWFDTMYDDTVSIMDLLHIDNKKFVCREKLLPTFKAKRKSLRKYIPREELVRIRNGRIRQGTVTYQPVHYIVAESNDLIATQIEEEIIHELRRAQRIISRRCITLSCSDLFDLEKHRYIIQNLHNLDGGVVIVNLNHCDINDARSLIKSVYSEENSYLSKYAVIFNVPEGNPKIPEAIGDICKIWPFITINNKRLSKQSAIKQLTAIATANDLFLSNEECISILKAQKDYSYDEINEMFRNWLLSDYTVNTYHPQYREKIDEYYALRSSENDALVELNRLIGLNSVKELCLRIIDYYELQKMRSSESSVSEGIGMHMLFTGNPGTAKTTVARIIARIFKQKGILSKGELVEVGRSDLVGKYVGWTARIVKDYFNKASGSVLFIDEAYSLVDDDKNSFGTEAINTIVQEMENRRDDVVVIFAGYKKEMHEFISANSGLESRISFTVDFPDYSGNELYEILELFAEKNNFTLESDVKPAFLHSLESKDTRSGNGRLVRNEFEKAKLRQAERIMKLPKAKQKGELFKLVGADFGGIAQ